MKDDEMERARALLIECAVRDKSPKEQELFRSGRAGFYTVDFNAAIAAMLAFAQQPEGSITDDEAFVWRWIERALYDPTVPMTDALNVLAHYHGAPWNRMRWNVDHKSYADQFYRNHPAAMLDVAPIPGEE